MGGYLINLSLGSRGQTEEEWHRPAEVQRSEKGQRVYQSRASRGVASSLAKLSVGSRTPGGWKIAWSDEKTGSRADS